MLRAVGSESISARVKTSGCATFSRGHFRLHLDCLPDGAYLHGGVNRHRYIRRHLDLLLHRVKSRLDEGNGISAWADVDDGVPSFTIGDHGARPFYQGRASGFDAY